MTQSQPSAGSHELTLSADIVSRLTTRERIGHPVDDFGDDLILKIQHAVAQRSISVEPDPELFVEPCAHTPETWHWMMLSSLWGLKTPSETELCRIEYHRCMLESLLKNRSDLPLVSIVIPAYNETEEILRSTLQSAFEQTYPNCEVILIDDGASEPLIDLIPDLADRIRYVRQENQGVPAARNRGIAEARGHFIHFLDADDLLVPTAIEEKLHAFRQVGDLELCFTLYQTQGDNGVRNAKNKVVPAVGDLFCPSRGMLRSVLRRFPFQISTMMFPRWVVLDVGPFDVELRQAQDNRQWFKLGMRGTKVAGLRKELTIRRLRPGSLTSHSKDSLWYNLRSYLKNFAELAAEPRYWTTMSSYWGQILQKQRMEFLFHSDTPRAEEIRCGLKDILRSVRTVAEATNYSCAPLMENLRSRLIELRFDRASAADCPYYRELLELIDELQESSPLVSERDYELWLHCPIIGPLWMHNHPAFRYLKSLLRISIPAERAAFWKEELQRCYIEAVPMSVYMADIPTEANTQKEAA